MTQEHTQAPDFSLPDQNNQTHALSDYKGQKILLYFYPKDDTPGCTTEAQNFRDRLNELKEHGVQVLGISRDNVQSHKKFAEKHNLNFPILSDEHQEVVETYDVLKEKNMFGKKRMSVSRESFLIDENGMILKHYNTVKPETHVDEILKDLQ